MAKRAAAAILRLLYAGGITHLRVGDSFVAIRDIYYVESNEDGNLTFTLRSGLAVSVNNEHQKSAIEGFRMLRDLQNGGGR